MLLLAYTLQLNIPGKFQKNIVGHFWVIQDYKTLFLVPLLFQVFWVLLCLEIWEVQPQQPSLQKEGTEPPMPCEGIIASSKRDTERLLVSMKAAEREENVGCSLEILPVLCLSKRSQKISLNHSPCQEMKERFGKREREMGLIAKCYRRFLQLPSPSPERQTSRDSQDYL